MPPHFLRGEVARLVMSYILEEQLTQTADHFLQESRDLPQEFKELPSEDLKEYCCVNQRNLVEILKEYKGVCNEIKLIAFDVDPDMYNKHKFDAPDTLLKAVVTSLKTNSTQNRVANTNNTNDGVAKSSVVKVASSNLNKSSNSNINTIDVMDNDIMDSQNTLPDTSPDTSQAKRKTGKTSGNSAKLNVQNSPSKTKKPREILPKTRFDINRTNPGRPEITLTLPPVPVPISPVKPVISNQGGQVYFQIPQGILSNAQPDTRITLPPVQLAVQQQPSVQVQQPSVQVQQPSVQHLQPIQSKTGTSGNQLSIPQRNKPDSDDEFLKGLLGDLGESIASIIPTTGGYDKQKISNVADTALENPDLYQGLYNLVDTCQQLELSFASLDDPSSRISTPIPASELDEELSNLQTEPVENPNITDLTNNDDNTEITNDVEKSANEPTASTSKEEEEIVNDKIKDVIEKEASKSAEDKTIKQPENTESIDHTQAVETASPSKRRSRKGKPKSNTELMLKEFQQAVKLSNNQKDENAKIQISPKTEVLKSQEEHDEDVHEDGQDSDHHDDVYSVKENAPSDKSPKKEEKSTNSENVLENSTETSDPLAADLTKIKPKKTTAVSGLLGKLINISKSQKAPTTINSEKSKTDMNTFQRRIGSLVRLSMVDKETAQDLEKIEQEKDIIKNISDIYSTKSLDVADVNLDKKKPRKQIRPRSLDGSSDEHHIAGGRRVSTSDTVFDKNSEHSSTDNSTIAGRGRSESLTNVKTSEQPKVKQGMLSSLLQRVSVTSESASDSDNTSKSLSTTNTSADTSGAKAASNGILANMSDEVGTVQGKKQIKKRMCRKCDGCKFKCGKCKVCEQNPAFGGKWERFKKQACKSRVCLRYPPQEPVVSIQPAVNREGEEVMMDALIDKVSIGNQVFSPSKIPIVIASGPTPGVITTNTMKNITMSSYSFKQPLPLDQLRGRLGSGASSSVLSGALTSTPIPMSVVSSLAAASSSLSTTSSSMSSTSSVGLSEGQGSATSHVRNLLFSPPDCDKDTKVEVIETTITLDSSIRDSLSDESNNWAVFHTTDLKEELQDENEVIMISPPKDPLLISSKQESHNQINSKPPAEKEIIKISYSPSKGSFKARTRRVPNILKRSPVNKPPVSNPVVIPMPTLPFAAETLITRESGVSRSGLSGQPGKAPEFRISIDPNYLMNIQVSVSQPNAVTAASSSKPVSSTSEVKPVLSSSTITTLTNLIKPKPKDSTILPYPPVTASTAKVDNQPVSAVHMAVPTPGVQKQPVPAVHLQPVPAVQQQPVQLQPVPAVPVQKKMTWDEKIRACLTEREMDMSHITKHVKERQARRQAQHKRKRSESEEEDDLEDEDIDVDGNSQDPLNPEIEKEIYSIGKTLLKGLEEKEKVESLTTKAKQSTGDVKTKMKKDKRDKSKEKQAKKDIKKDENKNPTAVSTSIPLAEAMPLLLASPLKSVQNNTPKRTSNSSKPLKKRSLKLSESDKGRGLIPVGEQIPLPEKGQISATDKVQGLIPLVDKDHSEIPVVDESFAPPVIHIQDLDVRSPVISIAEDVLPTAATAADINSALSDHKKDVKTNFPVTPKKQDDLTFKTPHKKSPQGRKSPLLKTPKTPRHLPLSCNLELLSPIAGFRRAMPKTPKSKQKESSELSPETKEKSSIDTPVLESPVGSPPPYGGNRIPTTPKGIKATSVPYYTPSPSTRDSFHSPSLRAGAPADTPGLKYLMDEGDRLSSSQGEESRSPRRMDVKKRCRKNFKDAFQPSAKLSSTQVGLLVEKGLNYSLSTKTVSSTAAPCTPEHSTSNNYKESPNLILTAPSTTTTPRNSRGFNSPNRTRYLSPDAANLGFSPGRAGRAANTDSESDYLVIAATASNSESETEINKKNKLPKKEVVQVKESKPIDKKLKRKETKITDFSPIATRTKRGVKVNLTSDLTEANESNKSIARPMAVVPQPPDIMTDNAVHDDGESLEDIKRAVDLLQSQHHSTLTSDADTLPVPPTSTPVMKLPLINTASNQMNLSEDSDSEMEEASKDLTLQAQTDSFISALKEVTTKKSDLVKPVVSQATARTPTTRSSAGGRGGRRISLLTSTKRISPLKNGSSTWEAQHDAHNLDNSRPAKRRAASVTACLSKKQRSSCSEEGGSLLPQQTTAGSGSHSLTDGIKLIVRQSSDSMFSSSSNSGLTVKIGETSMLESKELQLTVSPRKSARLQDKKKVAGTLEERENEENEDSETIHSSSSSEDSSSSGEESSEEHANDEASAEEQANDELSEQEDQHTVPKEEPESLGVKEVSKDIDEDIDVETVENIDVETVENVEIEDVNKDNEVQNSVTEKMKETKAIVDIKSIKVERNGITLTYQKLFEIS